MKPKHFSTAEKVFYGSFMVLLYLFILFFLAHFLWLSDAGYSFSYEIIMSHITQAPLEIFPLGDGFWAFALIITLVFIYVIIWYRHRQRFLPGQEEGSAKWTENYSKYNKVYTEPEGGGTSTITTDNKISKNMILTQNVFLSMDTRQTMRNNNVLVIGGSGAGKSRFFVKPNILQRNCSYVITDPSGELLESTGKYMEDNGYNIRIFNLVEMENSNRYNPFMYIRDDNGVNQLINILITNTTPQGASKGDPFWEKSETALLSAIIFYLYYEIKLEDQNFGNVMRMLLLGQVSEEDESFESPLDKIFNDLEQRDPSHMAVKYYKIFKQAAGKTAKSILISCTVRLSAFNLEKVKRLTSTDNMNLASVGDKPTVIYVVIPSADTTFNFLVSLLYSQLFESLYFHAENDPENCPGKRLKSHVRFLLDEFANIGTIPDFEKKLATMRKYEISCSVILQNLAQLKTMYKEAWESIIGNCDSFLFLGGSEQTTLEYVSKKLGKATILGNNYNKSKGTTGSTSTGENFKGRELLTPDELGRLENTDCVCLIRGLNPFYDKKYNYPQHPQYKYTGDADSKYNYDYRKAFANLRRSEIEQTQISEAERINQKFKNDNEKTPSVSANIKENIQGSDATAPSDLVSTELTPEAAVNVITGLGVSKQQLESLIEQAKISQEDFNAYFEFENIDANIWNDACKFLKDVLNEETEMSVSTDLLTE